MLPLPVCVSPVTAALSARGARAFCEGTPSPQKRAHPYPHASPFARSEAAQAPQAPQAARPRAEASTALTPCSAALLDFSVGVDAFYGLRPTQEGTEFFYMRLGLFGDSEQSQKIVQFQAMVAQLDPWELLGYFHSVSVREDLFKKRAGMHEIIKRQDMYRRACALEISLPSFLGCALRPTTAFHADLVHYLVVMFSPLGGFQDTQCSPAYKQRAVRSIQRGMEKALQMVHQEALDADAWCEGNQTRFGCVMRSYARCAALLQALRLQMLCLLDAQLQAEDRGDVLLFLGFPGRARALSQVGLARVVRWARTDPCL